ncbi:hypothetical protein GUITHDRAFT_99480 [Guillardia theta CCMP2712]|uniref:Uncharacterized protein n=1 Tax=Guillardia theta (strain CCMP2712) TaxID=905079 RepID=L1K2L4_GUITC|nr:hypothetical protein GUITHDRAFT_99480 [Guillardia theta CCMP2712]EKX54829.1 hypothetical protein GUITHDRAFT_99480 [Guillardia theta CCMP2712]|eukprot:XP_005841809.1 hypothetical protein GUITHDRAFT_99480 [Guillardia theta CCMP2712]
MFETIHHFQALSSCVGSNSCGVYFNIGTEDSGLNFGAAHLNVSVADANGDYTNSPGAQGWNASGEAPGAKAWLSDSNSTVSYSMTGSNQGMFTNGSAINARWWDTTNMDNIRGADITNHSIAGTTESINNNTAANNVRGGHSIHQNTTETYF